MAAMARGKNPAKQRTQKVSIETVARAADVSIATVSRVINNSELVSPETGARVRRAIDTLGFRPNRFAQGLMTRRSRVLGISLPDVYGEFYSAIMRAADARARSHGYHLLVATEPRRGDRAGEEFYMPLDLLDGLTLMITEPNERMLELARRSSIPMVLVDASPHDPMIDSVRIDNIEGTREATRHLLASVAPDRCYFVGGPAGNFDTIERSRAFLDVLGEKAGRAGGGQCTYGDYSLEWGHAWALRMVAEGRLVGAGVLAANDWIAWGIMQGARESGVDVPRQLRVVGFDDTVLSTLVRPRLSTVHVPLGELGSSAIDLLVRRIKDPGAAPLHVRLGTSLVVRETSIDERGAPGRPAPN